MGLFSDFSVTLGPKGPERLCDSSARSQNSGNDFRNGLVSEGIQFSIFLLGVSGREDELEGCGG